MNKWDRRIFDVCKLISTWSEDPHRQVGAVIVGQANQIIATGYNGFPRGVKFDEARFDRTDREKFHWVEHAERNALYNAARTGTIVENMTFYCSVFPCSDCARGIIQSGIKTLKTISPPKNDVSFKRGFEVAGIMLAEANITVELFDESEY
ncbi:MAG: dCMP deaminase [Rhizobiales bacterium]|nr:dCMP deaminase [Hyphomicrobiales bacterium]